MSYYKRERENTGCVMAIALLLIAIILGPLLTFWLGYFSGWIAKIIIGETLCEALTHLKLKVTPDMLPWIGGALAWIGSFFHSYSSSNSKRD